MNNDREDQAALQPVPGRPGWVRKKRYSLVASLGAAGTAFWPALLVTGSIGLALARELAERIGLVGVQPDALLIRLVDLVGVGIPAAISAAIAWGIYFDLRWEWQEDPTGRYCVGCGYDLTGNVSGRCPECGAETPRRTPHHDQPDR